MSGYRLLKKAENDLVSIADYTIQHFGIEQARLYRDGLFKVFEIITDFPLIGSNQGHIKKNMRWHVHELHSIYYRVDVDEIIIYRILGLGKYPLRHFSS
jgi:toxin ParE1/3/4